MDTKTLSLRLPSDVHTRAHAAYHAEAASENGPKSLNEWIVRAIKAALPADHAPAKPEIDRRKSLRAQAQRLCKLAKDLHDKHRLSEYGEILRTEAIEIRDMLKGGAHRLTHEEAGHKAGVLDKLAKEIGAARPLRDHVAKGAHDA